MNFTIQTPPRTKKNHSRIVFAKGRRIVIPSQQYMDFQKESKKYIPETENPIDYPINLKCIYYMPTKRKCDLVNLLEATCDVLVHHKLLADDNSSIVFSHDGSYVSYDKDNPRTEITITRI